MYQYEKVLKTQDDYYQHICINVVFLICFFLCKILLNICIALVVDFRVKYVCEEKIMYRYEKVDMINFEKTHNYFQNININVVFLLNVFYYFILYVN